ncbi:MAG: L,D-transpeptidase family protein [Gammaproteobacteria bacterium]|nr:L,D-transpeptidase family protein [Gammaproteobacteria bacterium]MDP2347028.1 L,D-transpeptidase family protein [Gammaproteobacteria bacterium]
MIGHRTIFFQLLLCSVFTSSAVRAADNLTSANLEQFLADHGEQSCTSLPTLRSVDLHTALTELYVSTAYGALWQDPQLLTVLQTELAELILDGLDPEEYGFALRAKAPVDFCAELRITSQYLLALEHLSRGRLAQEQHEPSWQADALRSASPLPALSELATTGLREGISASFEQARPALRQYRDLRAAYATMDRHTPSRPTVPPGPLLRPGMSDERIEQIAKQLQQDGFMLEAPVTTPASTSSSTIAATWRYDAALEDALRLFQANQGLQVDGIIGPQTIRALNISPAQRVQQVQINLERLRWINARRSEYLLLINVASGHIQLLRGNDSIWQARVQAGRPRRPTPAMVSHINRVTLNPSWTVPPTILREDILPQIRRNPDYLVERGIHALDAQGNLLDPQRIDWNSPQGIILRQPPGPTNPLGQMVFRLPNPFSIYLHDTPSQQLFLQANRNLSSGCVRVEDANGLADHLFFGMSASQRQRIAEQLASGQTHEVTLTNGPQVILAYWTAFANAEGRPAFVPDSYGLDGALGAALAGVRTAQRVDIGEIAMQAESGCALLEG